MSDTQEIPKKCPRCGNPTVTIPNDPDGRGWDCNHCCGDSDCELCS